MKTRLDQTLVVKGLVSTRSQAENYVRLGKVLVDGKMIRKPGQFVAETSRIELAIDKHYVSRAALKLESVAVKFGLDFRNKIVLDVGSSTGGFTDYALQNGAKLVVAVDVGTDQLHPKLRQDKRVELHEQTDIRDFVTAHSIDMVLIDVSFISLRQILPTVTKLSGQNTLVIVMFKPQFETGSGTKHKGIVKNDKVRRTLLKDFEVWLKQYYIVLNKADSSVAGTYGNRERFYLLGQLRATKQIAYKNII